MEASYEEFVDRIFRPPILNSLRSVNQKIKVILANSPATAAPAPAPAPSAADAVAVAVEETIEFDDLYPFNTIADLSTRIYIEKGERDEYHPDNQCILVPDRAFEGGFTHLSYLINGTHLLMMNPFKRMVSEPDGRFVDLTGTVKIGSILSRKDMLLEKTLFAQARDEYVIYLFLYKDILANFPGERPISRINWEGKFKPYFPEYNKAYEAGNIPEEVQQFTVKRVERFKERSKIIEGLNELLESKPLRIIGEAIRDDDVNVSNIRNLRIGWKERGKAVPFQLEGLFYDMPVGELVPYIRFYPKAHTPISKLFVEGPKDIPKLDDPTLLTIWASMRSITPEEDLLMMKVLVKKGSGSLPPVYGTFFVFEDGSAKFILQPSIEQKSLSGDVDLVHLPDTLRILFDSFPKLQPFTTSKNVFEHSYIPRNASLEDAYMVLSLWLSIDAAPISYKRLSKVLPYFRAFFQETSSPIKESRPHMFLRYKCVNNFRTPSRESQYLQRIIDLQKVAGRTSISDMEKYFKDEFNVSDMTARERVASFLEDMTKFAVVNPEIREVTQADNPGIDIAIFGKHPFYTFHIYRVDSLETLQRIKTLLSLMISVSPSDLSEYEESAEVLEEEEIQSKRSAEVEAYQSQSVGGAGQDLQLNGLGEIEGIEQIPDFEIDALGELPEFEESQPLQTLVDLDSEEGPSGVGGSGTAPAAAPAAAAAAAVTGSARVVAAAAAAAAADTDSEEEAEGEVSAKTYFSRRLRKYDSPLFKYGKVHKSTKSYPQQCQANALKQPAVLSEGEYKRMKELYKTDVAEGKLQWVEYPFKEDYVLPVPAKKKGVVTERVSVLRYGTNLDQGKANIYTCSEYWCMGDEIVITKGDFEGTRARDIRTGAHKEEGSKPKDTCPFCKKGLVKRKEKISQGESVIQRTTPKSHQFVGFLGKGNPTHPKGFYLPCCFIKDRTISSTNPAYKDVDVEEKPAFVDSVPMTYNYSERIKGLKGAYITGPDKLPLEYTPGHGPQIGVLPSQIDKYFSQQSNPDLVKQDHTFWKIMTDNTTKEPSVSGFFRIAVENRGQYEADSFLAAVAPFYEYSGAEQLKKRLYEIITPPVFMSLNYGNFLFEFYDPAYEIDPEFPLNTNTRLLIQFARELGIKTSLEIKDTYKESVLRGIKGYLAFKGPNAIAPYGVSRSDDAGILYDKSSLKESRQYYSLFTQPNLMVSTDKSGGYIRENGVLFIILELKGGELTVKCPPYGVSAELVDRCDIGFLIHYKDDRIWEPVFYTHNNIKKKEHYTTFIFSSKTKQDWPEIVQRRVSEYLKQCKSTGLGIYTDSKDVSSSTLIPLSKAMTLVDERMPYFVGKQYSVYAILRDSYNHVAALLFQQSDLTGAVADAFIILPVVDDGRLYTGIAIELTWKTLFKRKQLAKANIVDEFYTKLDPFFEELPEQIKPMYERTRLFRLDKTVPIYADAYAYHLKGGLFVPVLKPDVLAESGVEEGTEFEWMVDSKIVYTTDTKKADMFMDAGDFEEIYQHVRFTFANWLSTVEGSVVKEINEILYDMDGNTNLNLSLSEKRLRLFIKIGRTVLSWLDSSIAQKGKKPSLKRMDCRILRDAETCSNKCVWKGETSQCLIHIPKEYTVGRTSVPANAFMIKRLIEELVRFPLKRKELLTKRVRQYVTLRAPFRSGDSYIIPEYLPQWSDLLRMDWMKKKTEVPRHIEEFAWGNGEEEQEEEEREVHRYMKEFPIQVYYIPFADGLAEGYKELGVPELPDFPQGQEIPSVDTIEKISNLLSLSIVHIEFDYDIPVLKKGSSIYKLRRSDFIISVREPDGTVGFISLDPKKIVAIPQGKLPKGFLKNIFTTKK